MKIGSRKGKLKSQVMVLVCLIRLVGMMCKQHLVTPEQASKWSLGYENFRNSRRKKTSRSIHNHEKTEI